MAPRRRRAAHRERPRHARRARAAGGCGRARTSPSPACRTASRTSASRCGASRGVLGRRAAPATHLEPGVVVAHSRADHRLLDIGRYPAGVDERARAQIAAAFARSGLRLEPRARHLALEVREVPAQRRATPSTRCSAAMPARPRWRGARGAEAVAVLAAAGIDHVDDADLRASASSALITHSPGRRTPARESGSSWQSLARGAGTIEADQLNGEIVLLGPPARRRRRRSTSCCAGSRSPTHAPARRPEGTPRAASSRSSRPPDRSGRAPRC